MWAVKSLGMLAVGGIKELKLNPVYSTHLCIMNNEPDRLVVRRIEVFLHNSLT